MTTAGAIIIGDEILSGKVQDTNSCLLIQVLGEIGVRLGRMVTIEDNPQEIAEEVTRCAARYDYVFTSGGLGPTHDDRTVEGIAIAFGCPVTRHPLLEQMVRRYWKTRLNDAVLKMAELPEGSRLIIADDNLFPTVVFRNIYILPGVPQLFAAKLTQLRPELVGSKEALQSIFLSLDESSIAFQLTQVVGEFKSVRIGSYPRIGDPDHRVRVTVEGPQAEEVCRAVDRLLELLPPSGIIRVDRGGS